VAAIVMGRLAQALQMRMLLLRVGLEVPFRRVVLANALSSLHSLVLPSDVVAAFAKWQDLSSATGQRAVVLAAIVYNRIAINLGIVLGAALSVLFEPRLAQDTTLVVIWAAALLGLLALASVFAPAVGPGIERLAAAVLAWAPPRVRSLAATVFAGTHPFRALSAGAHAAAVVQALVLVPLQVGTLYAAAAATGLVLPLGALLWVRLPLLLASQLPITVGHLGLREGALALSLVDFGASAAQAVAMGFLMFAGNLVIVLVGALYQAALGLGLVRWSRA
jgi:hypothetical protein